MVIYAIALWYPQELRAKPLVSRASVQHNTGQIAQSLGTGERIGLVVWAHGQPIAMKNPIPTGQGAGPAEAQLLAHSPAVFLWNVRQQGLLVSLAGIVRMAWREGRHLPRARRTWMLALFSTILAVCFALMLSILVLIIVSLCALPTAGLALISHLAGERVGMLAAALMLVAAACCWRLVAARKFKREVNHRLARMAYLTTLVLPPLVQLSFLPLVWGGTPYDGDVPVLQRHLYAIDLLLNTLLANVPHVLFGPIVSLEPVAWYTRGALFLFKTVAVAGALDLLLFFVKAREARLMPLPAGNVVEQYKLDDRGLVLQLAGRVSELYHGPEMGLAELKEILAFNAWLRPGWWS